MLLSLHIENIALIRRLDLDLEDGFSVFTGETGAGKSILIDAIGLLCGARSERELVRSGEDCALVEGLFSVPEGSLLERRLQEADVPPDEDGTLFIQRKLQSDGKSSVKINGRACPLAKLREISPSLIRIHGQQDTAGLSGEGRQRELLDAFAGDREVLDIYRNAYRAESDARKAVKEHMARLAALEERKDLLSYQASELRQAKLKPGEEEALTAEHKLLANREKITEQASIACRTLYSGERSAVANVQTALSALRRLEDVLPGGTELLERLNDVKAELTDIAETLEEYAEPGGDAGRLEKVESRLDLLSSLSRKYRTDVPGLIEKLKVLEADLASLEDGASGLDELKKDAESKKTALRTAAALLTDARKQASAVLAGRVRDALTELDMPSVRFGIDLLPCAEKENGTSCGPDGADDVFFTVSANAGEEPKPIGKIASGGELSRIMLCLQFALADAEETPTMIFDEIDTGISGKTNEKIGRMMARVARETGSQVVCVTHAAQLASRSSHHYRISKAEADGRTETAIRLLDREGRIGELSRIMGGLQITDAVRKAAEELLEADP